MIIYKTINLINGMLNIKIAQQKRRKNEKKGKINEPGLYEENQ